MEPKGHYRLGEARAILGAARAHMYEILERVWESAKSGVLITTDQKCDMQLAGAFMQPAQRAKQSS